VLETLAKSGLPTSWTEITDAAMGQRAECVMLKKGTHILEAVKTLSGLLSAEERHYVKKRHVFRAARCVWRWKELLKLCSNLYPHSWFRGSCLLKYKENNITWQTWRKELILLT
jgi:hypothetical protein